MKLATAIQKCCARYLLKAASTAYLQRKLRNRRNCHNLKKEEYVL